jgi:hypothetical protein
MSFWDEYNPEKPTGIKDPNAVLDYPVDWSLWHEVNVTKSA